MANGCSLTNRDLYSDYDRLLSEAEFRLVVVSPVLLLSVAIALQVPALLVVEVGAIALVCAGAFFVVGDALAILRRPTPCTRIWSPTVSASTPTLDPGSSVLLFPRVTEQANTRSSWT